ncbi:MAG: polymer-forming cytoskeletal protein, partial [Phycisphaerae bacterium]
RRAMSVFCPHCKKRLILEDFKIRSYYAVRDFSTCGDIAVERKGHVVAPIKVRNLTIKGKVQGHVTARGKVSIKKTGWFKGEIVAPRLHVETGAVLDSFLRIGQHDE